MIDKIVKDYWDAAKHERFSKLIGGGVIMNKETKMYSIGQENVEGNEFAMWHGPNPNLDEMLSREPDRGDRGTGEAQGEGGR